MTATSDHNVTETALDAAKCKLCVLLRALQPSASRSRLLFPCVRRARSAVTQGYFRDAFLRLVVDKPSRRIPLVGVDAIYPVAVRRRCG